ncbi:MAG: TetR/AcrR family transcriptional regulator [Bauldia sp.]|nr:TetR/AcrR family transcriptional regulator [Bauldia sp.]
MTRAYTLKRRAEQQADTRRRIVEAAVELHGSVGPARTTFSMVAERAGVQRHTLYAHFPDEMSLHHACSGLFHERHPMPDPEPWREIPEPGERLRTGLRKVYDWYERNRDLLGAVLRDVELHAPTQEVMVLHVAPVLEAYRDVLGNGLSARQRVLLHLALDFHAWRTLTRDGGLRNAAAVQTMVKAIECAGS